MAARERSGRPAWTVIGIAVGVIVLFSALSAAWMTHGSGTGSVGTSVGTRVGTQVSEEGFMSHPEGMAMAGTEMPPYADEVPGLRAMYGFAMEHPEVMSYMPCMCGCGEMGHFSLWNCFVKSVDGAGTVVFEPHARGCQICQDITKDVMRMYARGSPISDIRDHVDTNFQGLPTQTELPPSA